MSIYRELMSALEALLFAAGEPLGIEVIAAILDVDEKRARSALEQLTLAYRRDLTRGLSVREIDGRFTLSTKPEVNETIARLYRPQHRPALSQAAYEVLGIVAYNKKVTRAQIEAVRGVNSDSALARLVERGYVEAVGHEESPGRPTVFSVTDLFLLEFGLGSTDELPAVDLMSFEVVDKLTRQFNEEE